VVIAVDGELLDGRPMIDLIKERDEPSHTLLLWRPAGPAAGGGGAPEASGGGGAVPGSRPASASTSRRGSTMTVIVDRSDGVSPLGVSIDDQNVVVAVDEGSPAEGVLLPGDKLLAVDGVALRKRRCVQVMRPQPTHTFQVRRDTGSRLERMALPAEIKAEIKAEVMSESSQPAKPRPPKPLLSERSGKGAKGSKKAVGSKKAFFGTRKNVFAYDVSQTGLERVPLAPAEP